MGSTAKDEQSVRIRVCYQRWWNRLPIVAGASVTPEKLGRIDVLVTNIDSDGLQRVTDTTGTRYVGPERLRTLSLYAINRDAGNDLFQRYFGRPIDTDRGCEVFFNWFRAHFAGNDCQAPVIGYLRGNTGSTRTVMAVAVVIILFTFTTVSVAGPPGRISAHTPPSGSLGDDWLHIDNGFSSGGYPPGINHSGLTDSAALIAAHRNAVDDRIYRLIIRHEGTRGRIVTTGRWYRSQQRILKQSDDQYQYTVDGLLPPKTIGSEPTPVQFGIEGHELNCTGWMVEFEKDSLDEDPCSLVESERSLTFADVTSQYLDRYLDGRKSTVYRRANDDRTQYRVVVTGIPDGIVEPATDYTAVAFVTESGFVRKLSVTYETPVVDRSGPVRFVFRFENIERRA